MSLTIQTECKCFVFKYTGQEDDAFFLKHNIYLTIDQDISHSISNITTKCSGSYIRNHKIFSRNNTMDTGHYNELQVKFLYFHQTLPESYFPTIPLPFCCEAILNKDTPPLCIEMCFVIGNSNGKDSFERQRFMYWRFVSLAHRVPVNIL